MTVTTIYAQIADYKALPTEFVSENNTFEFSDKNASELYQLTKNWMSTKYDNPIKVIVFDDENRTIKIKNYFDIHTKMSNPNKINLNIRLFTQVSYISNYESIKHLFSEISSIEFIYKFIEVEL